MLQVRADLVDTAQRTLEGEAARETHEANVKELVEKRTQQLMVRFTILLPLLCVRPMVCYVIQCTTFARVILFLESIIRGQRSVGRGQSSPR